MPSASRVSGQRAARPQRAAGLRLDHQFGDLRSRAVQLDLEDPLGVRLEGEARPAAGLHVPADVVAVQVHLHGYDISRDVKPGSRARFSFEANAEGIFEVELHGSGTQIAELVVEP